jgi:hypothetical protein
MALPSSLQHLQNIPPAFLEPHASFVVMPEDTENALDTARLALDAVTWLCHASSNQNAKLRNAGAGEQFLDIPPESMAALLSLVGEKISIACNNPTLSAMRQVRPDLFRGNEGGV